MNTPEIDYKAVLADMELKRAALDAAIDNMKRWLGVTVIPQSVNQSAMEIASDAFFAMSIPDAVKKFLGMSKAKKTTNEIVQALERGGIIHNSKNFRNTVSTALYREDEKPNGEIVRVSEGEWGLTEWYPGIKAKRAKSAKGAEQAGGEFEGVGGTAPAPGLGIIGESVRRAMQDKGKEEDQGITDDDVPF